MERLVMGVMVLSILMLRLYVSNSVFAVTVTMCGHGQISFSFFALHNLHHDTLHEEQRR